MKKTSIFIFILLAALSFALFGCHKNKVNSEVQKVIQEAQSMTLEELAQKAIEESKGKTFKGVGNSSRVKDALPLFVEYLKTFDNSYTLSYEWESPKNNKIFDQLRANSFKDVGDYSMTLIQDGNQIETKMVQTGVLDTFIPKEWAEANNIDVKKYNGYLSLQTLSKVFMYNCVNPSYEYKNCWDFVADGKHGLFYDMDSEVVGKNFLYMLTKTEYSKVLKEAFDALPAQQKASIQLTVDSVEKDAKDFGLDENGKYALAWIKRWVGSYTSVTNDGSVCARLVDEDAEGEFGLLVYSKLRLVEETEHASKNNVKVAAYEDGYQGFGGFGYCHYLFVTANSPLPWTACALISYMCNTVEGFSAWGKDIGGYASNPVVAAGTEEKYKHLENHGDKGFEWWVNQGKLVLEDPEYCAKVQSTIGSWLETLDRAA